MATLLAQRGVDSASAAESFLHPGLSQLTESSAIAGLDEAAEIVGGHVAEGRTIVVVGDYDADGVTSTALLVASIRQLGGSPVAVLPRRDAEGYGLQPAHVAAAAERGASLLVAVDSGTTAVDAWHEAARRRLPLVVLDHHLSLSAEGPAPPVDVHLANPRFEPTDRSAQDLTAAGLAARLSALLFDQVAQEVPWDSLARLAAIGTVADVAPLSGDNRALVSHGLAKLAETPSVGLRALFDVAAVRPPHRAADIAFRLAPRLNAAGRLGRADDALELLLTRDPKRAGELARALDARNAERQAIERRILDDARRLVAERGELAPIVVLSHPDWHRGVVGVAAARLAREFHRPVILLAEEGESATGSGRSVAGLALHDLIRPSADELERFGGHAQAVGLTVAARRLPALRARWEEAAVAWSGRLETREIEFDADLDAQQAGMPLLQRLSELEPHGSGNPEPTFRLRGCRVSGTLERFGNGHLRFSITERGSSLPVIAWGSASRPSTDFAGEIDLLAALELDRFLGPRLRLLDVRPTDPTSD